ncbi:hypothetical protein [Ktedonospora formicarum]|uniref:Uncharacterized protein n=1 Tax=Ktedonospora formicarum TaxID=2778364 RepID=A0A8J3IB91_9CHLR|nr:hypothetical protein [Ktedonospora formicarum]GHO50115.1 hypothetical protein KSX_82780 [Ktedonospora formicarum]
MSDQIPTIADVCVAISDGGITAACIEGAEYQINALELRRYLAKRELPPSFARLLASIPDPNNYVSPTICTIGQ